MTSESSQNQLIREVLERGEVLTGRDIDKLCYDNLGWGCQNHKGRAHEVRKELAKEGKIVSCNELTPVTRNGKTYHVGIYYLKNLYTHEEAVERRFLLSKGMQPRDDRGRFKTVNNPLNKRILEEARTMYENGLGLRQICARFQTIPLTRLREELIAAGVKMRPPGQPKQAEFEYGRTT